MFANTLIINYKEQIPGKNWRSAAANKTITCWKVQTTFFKKYSKSSSYLENNIADMQDGKFKINFIFVAWLRFF